MTRKEATWGDIYHRWLAKGVDHSYAAAKADAWQARRQKQARPACNQEVRRAQFWREVEQRGRVL